MVCVLITKSSLEKIQFTMKRTANKLSYLIPKRDDSMQSDTKRWCVAPFIHQSPTF